jgi:hypothetical protein
MYPKNRDVPTVRNKTKVEPRIMHKRKSLLRHSHEGRKTIPIMLRDDSKDTARVD